MRNKKGGFTLIELVVVLVLISILALYAAPKISNVNQDMDSPFYNLALSRIRAVQEINMTSDDGSCALAVISPTSVKELRTPHKKCYEISSVVIPYDFRNEYEDARFATVALKLGTQSVAGDSLAVVSFDRLGNVRACGVTRSGKSINFENKDCRLSFGPDFAINISKIGAIY
jgi:prepilin-type N-terminal cleavage/methylation domain-containing protein